MVLDHLFPAITPSALDFFRSAYGVLLLITLAGTISQGRRFFLSERWGGYGESCLLIDSLHNPVLYPVCMTLWASCAVCLAMGWLSLWAAAVNLLICRYYCLRIRWKTLLRGLGAPGFMISWLALAVCVFEFCRRYTPQTIPLALLVVQIDFGVIMFAAGFYKLNSGYLRGEGFEYALVNRQWCYWWNSYRRLPPRHWVFWANNQLAWAGEMLGGILLIIPGTRLWGAALICGCFSFIITHLRLLQLCQMVMLTCILYVDPATRIGNLLGGLFALAPASTFTPTTLPVAGVTVVTAVLWTYLALLPFIYAGLFYNFYLRRRLPRGIQTFVEQYANFAGIVLWRVFSADLTHFFIQIYRASSTGERTLVSRWGTRYGLRFGHVGEALTVTSLFTMLKYQPDNWELFATRVLRYARTLPIAANESLIFEFNNIEKSADGFVYKPVSEFEVRNQRVTERKLEPTFSARAFMPHSPAFRVSRPGSYLTAGK